MGGIGSGRDRSGDPDPRLEHYCGLYPCSRLIPRDRLLCTDHARLVPEDLAAELAGIPDPRRLLSAPPDPEVLRRLEVVALALEAVAGKVGMPPWNPYRHREGRLLAALAIGAGDPRHGAKGGGA